MSVFYNRKTQVYTIDGFLRNKNPIRIEGGLTPTGKIMIKGVLVISMSGLAIDAISDILFQHPVAVFASPDAIPATSSPVSSTFDRKIWPLILDIGKPLSKTMIAMGIYQCIRSNVDKGWKMVQHAGLGLIGLYLIDGVIHILTGVGTDLANE